MLDWTMLLGVGGWGGGGRGNYISDECAAQLSMLEMVCFIPIWFQVSVSIAYLT